MNKHAMYIPSLSQFRKLTEKGCLKISQVFQAAPWEGFKRTLGEPCQKTMNPTKTRGKQKAPNSQHAALGTAQ